MTYMRGNVRVSCGSQHMHLNLLCNQSQQGTALQVLTDPPRMHLTSELLSGMLWSLTTAAAKSQFLLAATTGGVGRGRGGRRQGFDLWRAPRHSPQGGGVNLEVRQQHHVMLNLSAAYGRHSLFFRRCSGRWQWGTAWLQAYHGHTTVPEAYLCRHICSLA